MIVYKGKHYPSEFVVIPNFGERLISVQSLEEALMPNGEYASDEAKGIDNYIFYYVPDEVFGTVNLTEYVTREVM